VAARSQRPRVSDAAQHVRHRDLAGVKLEHVRVDTRALAPTWCDSLVRLLDERFGPLASERTHALVLPIGIDPTLPRAVLVLRTIAEEAEPEKCLPTEADTSFLALLGRHVAVALENAVLLFRTAESEMRVRTILERMPEAIFVVRDGVVLWANAQAARALGAFGSEAIIGMRYASLVHPEDRLVFEYAARRALDLGVHPVRKRLLRSNGDFILADVVLVPMSFDDAPALLLVATDRTEQETMRSQLAQTERLASVGTLAAGVAHEINNPLAYVMLSLERLAKRTQGTDEETLATSALDGARRIRAIVQDLKTFARPDADRREPVRLVDVVRTVLTMTAHETRYRASVECNVDSSLFVRGDAGRIAQVFLNLVLNAAQAIGDGGPDCHRIVIGAERSGDQVLATVSDTGRGISQADIARIFDPFFTTKEATVGSGLGLSISRSIIEAHGGRIDATSEVGRGTTVRVVLPASAESKTGTPHEGMLRPQLGRRLRVLVVDDEPVLCLLVEQLLSPQHEVVVFGNGRDARDHLAGDVTYDVILCDVMMPDVTGVDLHAFLASTRPELAGCLAFVTGGAFKPRTRALVERTGRPVLDKPFRREDLLALVDRIASSKPVASGGG
jgi:PAS domain S-box-containing protein